MSLQSRAVKGCIMWGGLWEESVVSAVSEGFGDVTGTGDTLWNIAARGKLAAAIGQLPPELLREGAIFHGNNLIRAAPRYLLL